MKHLNRKLRQVRRNTRLVAIIDKMDAEAAVNNVGMVCPEVKSLAVIGKSADPIRGDLDRYARSLVWEQEKAEKAAARKTQPAVEPWPYTKADDAAEKMVKAIEHSEEQEAPVGIDALAAKKVARAKAGILAMLDAIEVAEQSMKEAKSFLKASSAKYGLTESAVRLYKAKKAALSIEISELEKKILRLYRKIEKEQARVAAHLKKVAEAQAEAELKATHEAEEIELRYLFGFGEFWAEVVAEADKAVREAIDAYTDIDFKYERKVARLEAAEKSVGELKAQQKSLKAKRTRKQKRYATADATEQAAMYTEVKALNAETKAVIEQLPVAKAELEKAVEDLAAYALAMPEMKAAADKALAEACEYKQAILAEIRHEKKYAKVEEAIADTLKQRYERAEWVPEKEDAVKYKVYSIKTEGLYSKNVRDAIEVLAKHAETRPASVGKDAPADQQAAAKAEYETWLADGKKLYKQLTAVIATEKGAYKVDAKYATVNNVTASAMSDIMQVKYGLKVPCTEMVLVNYDITNTIKVYWKFVDDDYKTAQTKLHNMRVWEIKRLLKDGIELTVGDKVLSYQMLASSNSQQKKGQAYMGEVETMKKTELLREFGWNMNDAIARRTDNAAEWLKRNATLTTPSRVIKDKDGNTVKVARILMCNDIDVEVEFDNVATIGEGELDDYGCVIQKSLVKNGQKKKLSLTKFDGQAIWLKPNMPTTQGRGPALKYMACALPEDYRLPEYAKDIMGNMVRVADYDILMTKSCWKAAKMGMNWYQFREKISELAKDCPGYDLLRSVRYSDREVGDEENPRNLARQATQQWIKVTDEDIEGLTRDTRRWLKNHKKYSVILADLGEWDKPVEERSNVAKIFNRCPQLVMHPAIQQWIKTGWTAKRDKACSGRLRTKGMYPYIVQDPWAMLQILLEGRDPMDKTIGLVPAGKVNLPKVQDGRKMFAIRYPANYMVGMILEQLNIAEFANLGNVAVLSYHDDAIVRADGDFDGDEMLFIFSKLVIELMERTIKMFNPSLIDFPHGKVACNKPFMSYDQFVTDVAEALVRAQEYNLVGLYSNLAVICLQQASTALDSATVAKWLNAAKVAHVGAIVCLDMVKGADVPEALKDLLSNMNSKIREEHSMPWNQLFSHGELATEDVEARSNSTQDRIAGAIFDDCGEFTVEFEDGEEKVTFEDDNLRMFVPNGIEIKQARNVTVSDEIRDMLRGCHFEDSNDAETWEAIEAKQEIGWKKWLLLGWHNASSMLWKMSGTDMVEKREELYSIVREVVIDGVRSEWLTDGKPNGMTMKQRYASMMKNIICNALGFWIDNNGAITKKGNAIDDDKKGSYLMFVLHVFAKDILWMFDHNDVEGDGFEQLVAPRQAQRDEEMFDELGIPSDYYEYEDASVLDDEPGFFMDNEFYDEPEVA